MKKKQFSIIIPTHDGASHGLFDALHSITMQCYDRDKYEIIVICDRCSDNSEELAKRHADKVKAVDHGNAGMSRNEGLALADGEWILFMDDDDRWTHEFVLQHLDRYARADDFDILVFAFIFGERGIALPLDNCGALFPNVWSKMFRREFIGETKFRNVYPNDDELFCKDIFEKSPRVRVSDSVNYYYNYMRPGSITDTERKKECQ